MSSNKDKRLAKNSLLFFVGEMSSKVIVFLMVPFYTSILSAVQYSICDLITTTVALSTPFFTAVIYEAVMRFTLDIDSDKKSIFSIGLYINIIGTIILAVLSFFIFPYLEIVKDYWIYFILYFFIANIYSLQMAFIKGLDNVKLVAIIGILHTVLIVVLNILFLVIYNLDIRGYLLAFISATAIVVVILMLYSRIYVYVISPTRIDKSLLLQMLKYAVPMIPNSAMWWINNSSDRYIVTYMISTAANGIYSVGYKIPTMFSSIVSIFMSAWQISVVEDFGTDSGNKFFNKIYNLFIQVNIVLSAFLIILAPIIGRFIYLNEFAIAWKYSVVLIIGYSFHSLSGFLGTVYTSAKDTKFLFISTAVAALANLILSFILISILLNGGSFIASMGAAIATNVSYFISYVIRRIMVKDYLIIDVNTKLYCFEYFLMFIMAFTLIIDTSNLLIISVFCFLVICFLSRSFFIDFLRIIKHKLSEITN